MIKHNFKIGNIPATLWGKESEKLVNACTGQMSTHAVHSPHRGSLGAPVGWSGASVRIVTHRTRGPWSGVTSRQLFPIQPRPAMCAASFWEKIPQMCSSLVRFEAGTGNAP